MVVQNVIKANTTMNDKACKKGKFEAADLRQIQEAIHLAGLDRDMVVIESDWHFVNINHTVEIQPVLFDCRGEVDAPSWVVRSVADASTLEPCSCGVMERGGEIGKYPRLDEAIAAAIAEVVRLKVMTGLQSSALSSADSHMATLHLPKLCKNDFIRHSLHR